MRLAKKTMRVPATSDARYCVFEYLYRDASNYKAWGRVLLLGTPLQDDVTKLRVSLESGEYFVAELVGIPPVYKELWKLSDGPTSDDHRFHEFVALRSATVEEEQSLPLHGELSHLLKTFQAAYGRNRSSSRR